MSLQEIECRPHETEARYHSAEDQTNKNGQRLLRFIDFDWLNKFNHCFALAPAHHFGPSRNVVLGAVRTFVALTAVANRRSRRSRMP